MAGIYIHIPFCRQACNYCNFHFSTSLTWKNDFVKALLKEIPLRSDYLGGETVNTIYFGGGTPSLLPASDLSEILATIYRHFPVGDDPEITLEANPDDMERESIKSWKRIGINRLSIGIQSFFGEDLRWMNRAHDEHQAFNAILEAQTGGFDNISIDLIFGLPTLSDERWEQNIEKAVSLGIPHLSCYALTVEPKTPLQKKIREGKMANVIPEDQARQFLSGIELLESAGYEQYEISNFAQPGRRSRHNSAYWQSEKYLGLGPSAHSFDGEARQWNLANNKQYIDALLNGKPCFEKELLNPTDKLNEYIMTSLRTIEGLDLARVHQEFGTDAMKRIEEQVKIYIQSDQMRKEQDRLVLTRSGKLFADGIAAALFSLDDRQTAASSA